LYQKGGLVPDNQELLATTLLGAPVPNELIAVTLYQRASLKEKTPRQMTALPAPYALATAKDDGWQAAAMQAMSAVDPMVITTLARDRRVHVRLALAENPNITTAVANDLWAWLNTPGVESNQKAHTNVARNADLAVLMDHVREHPHALTNYGNTSEALQIIVARVFASGDAAYYDALLASSLREEVLRRTVKGDAPVDLDEMIQRYPEGALVQLVRSLVKVEGLTRRVLEMVIANDMLGDNTLNYSLVVSDEVFEDVVALDPSLAENTTLYTLVMRSKMVPKRAGALLARFSQHEDQNEYVTSLRRTLYRNFDASIKQLSAKELLDQLPLVDEHTATRFTHAIIEKCRVGTEDETSSSITEADMLHLMKDAPVRYLSEWVSGKLIVSPAPGDVFSVVKSHPELKNRNSDYWTLLAKAREDVSLGQHAAKEVLLACPAQLTRLCGRAKDDQFLRELLNQVITEALGDDPRTWMAFIEGANESVTLLADLVKAREGARIAGFAVPAWVPGNATN
jgi:hypothetical protein